MFGHQDEPTQQAASTNDNQQPAPADNSYVVGGQSNASLPPADVNLGAPAQPTPPTDSPSLLEPQATDGFTVPEASSTPPTDSPVDTPSDSPTQAEPTTVGSPSPLGDLKQQALQQLSPLVGHLEQTPEEKFRTTMMMIQASDNQDLLQTAYDAANQITDEKAKAQALLDVINEINYFSQK